MGSQDSDCCSCHAVEWLQARGNDAAQASAPWLLLLGLGGPQKDPRPATPKQVWSQDKLLHDGLYLLQALLPVGNSCDLFYHPPPLFPSRQLYLLRPLLPQDEVRLMA